VGKRLLNVYSIISSLFAIVIIIIVVYFKTNH
jgi:hypothetical protein